MLLQIRLANTGQPQLHGVAAQTLQVQDALVALLQQIAGGKFADALVVGRDAVEPHAAVAAVD
ncbi:Uncharacterised protein [Serratia rubidaea]|uniref:Uncharacterized protein n=1 Tax=Serratia rubidaea TaxID=61652 RepID=A0A4U9HNY3_SERRU|nr:Uncharacterised protein [Serratia rubidaea]